VVLVWMAVAAAMPLQRAAERLLDEPRTTRTLVVWGEADEPLVDVRGAQRVTPASTAKLITAAVVVDAHGPDAVFETVVSAAGPVDDGVLQGALVVEAGGDPSLGDAQREGGEPASAVLGDWVARVQEAGVRRIAGDVVADTSAWTDPNLGAGWMWDDVPYAFSAPYGPLNLGHNRAAPGCASVGGNAVDPACCAVRQLHAALQGAGIEVEGEAVVAGLGPALPVAATCPVTTAPPGPRTVIARTTSPPLRSLVGHMLERSDNLYAEVLARSLADDGAYDTAWERVADTLERAGVAPGDVVLADGSGLSRYSLVTSRSLVALLAWIDAQPWGEAVLGALPVAGRSGTLRRRLVGTELVDQLRGKTGSMRGVRNLVGEVADRDGRILRFATTATGFVHSQAEARAAEDRLLKLLAISRRGRVARRALAELRDGG